MDKQLLLGISVKEETEGGYSVVCTDLDIASQGETVEEAKKNIREAVELYIESAEDLGIIDEVLEKVGVTRKEARSEAVIVPRIFRAEIPVNIAL